MTCFTWDHFSTRLGSQRTYPCPDRADYHLGPVELGGVLVLDEYVEREVDDAEGDCVEQCFEEAIDTGRERGIVVVVIVVVVVVVTDGVLFNLAMT